MKGWRTIAFNVGAAVLGVIVSANWSDVLPVQYAWVSLVIVNLANIGMRFVTDTAVGQKT